MLDAQARQAFIDSGYLVIPDVIPGSLCQEVVDAIDRFRSQQHTAEDRLGIVPLHHDPAMWKVRQHPALYEAFRDLYQRDDLWVSMDRVGYKPAHGDLEQHAVHWDCDPWKLNALSIQGLVYLTDTAEDQGAFACVPSIYTSLAEWRAEHESDTNRHQPKVPEDKLVRLAGRAGSLVVFHRLMPHTNTVNTSDLPRYVQYVAMQPRGTEEERDVRVKEFQERRPPAWAVRQKITGQLIPEPGDPPPLTDLGRKLVGLDSWP